MTTTVRLGLFPESPWQMQGEWHGTPDIVRQTVDPGFRVRIARLAEDAGIDFLFTPDKQTTNGSGEQLDAMGNSWLEPITTMSYLAAKTERIGLIATASTAWSEPFTVARMFQSLDHLSGGRAGWNAVSSHPGLENHNFGHRAERDRDATKRAHDEFVDVVRGLWDSWADDAVVGDVAGGLWTRPGSVRPIDHAGEFFRVAGPLNVQRSPQGRPVVVMAGESPRFIRQAARAADIVFTRFSDVDSGIAFTRELRAAAGDRTVLVMPSAVILLSDAASGRRAPEGDADGHLVFTGTAAEVAAQMARTVGLGLADGFIVLPRSVPADVERLTAHVVPALRELGVRPDGYAGPTLRENLGLGGPM